MLCDIENDIEKVLYSEEQINDITTKLGEQITKDYEGKNLLIVGILKGCVFFLTDLVKKIKLPLKVDFMDVSSYGSGTVSSGKVNIIKDLEFDVKDYDVLFVEDILDTGRTLKCVTDMIEERGAKSVKVVTLLDKPDRRVADIKADYIGSKVPDEFVVGYGLDYDQMYRNLPYVGVLKRSVYEK